MPPARPLPPKVNAVQWSIVLGSLALAAFGSLGDSYEQAATVALVLVAINTILVLLVAYEGLQQRVLGKFLLVGATHVFFWVGLLDAALGEPSFAVSAALRVGTRRWPLDLVHASILAVALFQAMLLFGYDLRPRWQRLTDWCQGRLDLRTSTTKALPYIFGGLGVLTLLLSYRFSLQTSAQALLASRNANVQTQDIGLLSYLNFFALYGAALVFNEIFLAEREASLPKSLRIFGAIIVAAPFIAGGTRHLALFALLPAVILMLKRWRGGLTGARALRWVAAGTLVLAIMESQFLLRQWGWTNVHEAARQGVELDQFGQFEALLYAEFLVPGHHPYFFEPAEPFFVIHWIPRMFWPDKPVMQSWLYYDRSFVGQQEFNVTPSIIGQYHMNWGTAGVLFAGLWLGLLGALSDRVFLGLDPRRGKAMGVTLGMFYAFLISSFRFYSPVYFYYFVFGTIGMLAMTRGYRPQEVRYQTWDREALARRRWSASGPGIGRPMKP